MIMTPPLELCNVQGDYYSIVDSNNNCLLEGNQYCQLGSAIPDIEEAQYIIKVVNEFPRAIELLEELNNSYNSEGWYFTSQTLKEEIDEFLTKLKENEENK